MNLHSLLPLQQLKQKRVGALCTHTITSSSSPAMMHHPAALPTKNDGGGGDVSVWSPAAPSKKEEHLVQDLCGCAGYVEAGAIERAGRCLARATGVLAGDGDGPLQRVAAPMADALARRLIRLMVPAVADALIDPSAHLDRRRVRAARRSFFELSPFHRAAAAVANQAILEAMENQKNVHIIDFAGPTAQPWQWIKLLHGFRRRRGGPPQLRLTIVHDDGDLLASISERLADEAEALGVPLQVRRVVAQIEALDPGDLHAALGLRSGEARAVVCTLQLHRLLAAADDPAAAGTTFFSAGHRFNRAASVARLQQMASTSCPPSIGGDDDDDSSPATPLVGFASPPLSTTTPSQQQQLLQTPPALARFLSAARALAPEVVVVTEQEASHGGGGGAASFRKRFGEALGYYAAVFDSLDAAAQAYRRPAAERAEVERAVLGEEIRDVLLRDGARRRERHDRLQRWAARMELAGFRSVPLSFAAMRRGNDVLDRCGLAVAGCAAAAPAASRVHGGCLLLRWSSWPLYSVSAWRPEPDTEAPSSGSPLQLISTDSAEQSGNGGST